MEFDPALVAKLRERADRFEELTQLVSDPDVMADGRRLASAAARAREPGALRADVRGARRALVTRRREAEEILAEDPDGELAELARADLEGLDEVEARLDESR